MIFSDSTRERRLFTEQFSHKDARKPVVCFGKRRTSMSFSNNGSVVVPLFHLTHVLLAA